MDAMTDVEQNLDPPFLLVAMPQVVDPFFHRSVVLMLEHEAEGSFGMIVNRPTELAVGELLEGLEIPWSGEREDLTWFGGPVQPNLGSVLFLETDLSIPMPSEGVLEIGDGVRLSQDIGVLRDLAAEPPPKLRVLLGYAGWAAGQLEQEMDRNDWLVVPFDAGILFDLDPTRAWTRALESIGIRPESLPSFVPPTQDEAN